jgi:hypothetical protein
MPTLEGAQLVPPVSSPASGSATVTLDATETGITVDAVFADLTSNDTSAFKDRRLPAPTGRS